MKNVSFFIAALAMFAMLGCAAGKVEAVDAQYDDLAGKAFVLAKINGQAHKIKNTPVLEFSDSLRAAGSFCNRFMGQAELQFGVLTVPKMASTMMMCADPAQNDLERQASQMLTSGAVTEFDGKTLTLSRGDYSLEYKLVEKK